MGWFFMRIDAFKDFFYIKKCCEDVFVFVGMIFERYYKFNYFLGIKRGYRNVFGTGKNVWGL